MATPLKPKTDIRRSSSLVSVVKRSRHAGRADSGRRLDAGLARDRQLRREQQDHVAAQLIQVEEMRRKSVSVSRVLLFALMAVMLVILAGLVLSFNHYSQSQAYLRLLGLFSAAAAAVLLGHGTIAGLCGLSRRLILVRAHRSGMSMGVPQPFPERERRCEARLVHPGAESRRRERRA